MFYVFLWVVFVTRFDRWQLRTNSGGSTHGSRWGPHALVLQAVQILTTYLERLKYSLQRLI